MQDGLLHRAGDVETLRSQFDLLDSDRALLRRLRETGVATAPAFTWEAAADRLLEIYHEGLARRGRLHGAAVVASGGSGTP
jgi:hypothetical protein